ncbi:hypothetical protein SFV1gp62 [Sulfolobus filamentous virus 1]|uniref:Uncharacterized protein n=2 Tax=Alphalipothrixvirus beppuense TaxID=2734584 RepID=A0A346LUA1_SUFV1|nr:hypothetical protein HOT91_gp62 [Sulfolobus filamentous virus 1]AXQ00144.1 hypothetical protein SFV1gp62 [Sulfolobus filamentous virus 1]AZI75764.1 hypothetical protein SBFV1_gp63 [Sulfolobales Beppu filamentous phage 1]
MSTVYLHVKAYILFYANFLFMIFRRAKSFYGLGYFWLKRKVNVRRDIIDILFYNNFDIFDISDKDNELNVRFKFKGYKGNLKTWDQDDLIVLISFHNVKCRDIVDVFNGMWSVFSGSERDINTLLLRDDVLVEKVYNFSITPFKLFSLNKYDICDNHNLHSVGDLVVKVSNICGKRCGAYSL